MLVSCQSDSLELKNLNLLFSWGNWPFVFYNFFTAGCHDFFTCSDHGSCSDVGTCQCVDGFYGDNCSSKLCNSLLVVCWPKLTSWIVYKFCKIIATKKESYFFVVSSIAKKLLVCIFHQLNWIYIAETLSRHEPEKFFMIFLLLHM